MTFTVDQKQEGNTIATCIINQVSERQTASE